MGDLDRPAPRPAGSVLNRPELQGISALFGIIGGVTAIGSSIVGAVAGFTASPWFYALLGAAVGVAVMALLLYGYARLRTPSDEVIYVEHEPEFYALLSAAVRGARAEMYRSGTGFSRKRQASDYNELLAAERYALDRGVTIKRIQTASMAIREWSQRLAEMMDESDGQLTVYEEFLGRRLFDVCLVDPESRRPFILFLREEEDPLSPEGARSSFAGALVLRGYPRLAKSLKRWYDRGLSSLQRMDSTGVRALGRTSVYFAYGTHMHSARMAHDDLTFIRHGRAELHGYRRVTSYSTNPRQHVVQLVPDPDGTVEGVAYVVSDVVRVQLDVLERQQQAVRVEVDLGATTEAGFTYLPRMAGDVGRVFLSRGDVDDIVNGAKQNKLACRHDLARWRDNIATQPEE